MCNPPAHPAEGILDELDHVANQHDPLTLGDIMDVLGKQSFASILLLIGLIMMVPGPADIPGVPIFLGLLVIIIAVQVVLRREHLWIPAWIAKRKVTAQRARKMSSWMRKPARWIDRLSKPRLHWLVNHAGVAIIAIACIIVAMTTPILEFVPFSANLAGAAIVAFAMALLAKDGLLAGVAIGISVATLGVVIYQLMN